MSQPLRSSSGAGRIFLTVFAIFWLGFSLVWEGVAIAAWLGGGGLFFMALFGLPFVAIGIVLLIVALKPLIVGLKLAPPEISLSADAVRVGEELRFTYRQAFKKPVAVTRIAIVFLFRESATYRQGTDTHTATHEEVIDAAELGGQSFPAGAVFTDERPLRIPPDAMHSFSASHNRLQWFVRLHVEISGWPDIKEEYEVRVLPERVLPEKVVA